MKKQILILGAGFGGLSVAVRLGRVLSKNKLLDKYRILLIDKHAYHTYTPLLYEIATIPEDVAGYNELSSLASFPVAPIVSRFGVDFETAEISRLELSSGDIITSDGKIFPYDYLVVALGSTINYFGVEGLAENSLPFKTLNDALRIRARVSSLSANFEGKQFKIVVGGAGSTGVELASELQLWLCGESSILPKECSPFVTLIDSAPNPVSSFTPNVIARVRSRLEQININLLMNAHISKVDENHLTLQDNRQINFDVLIWAGGVRQNSLVTKSGAYRDERSLVLVNKDLSLEAFSKNEEFKGRVYGIGDTVGVTDEMGRLASLVAPEAIGQAKTVASNIISDILKSKKNRNHQVRTWPYIIPVGGKWAVAKFGNFIFSGILAWIFKGVVERRYLVSVLGWWNGTRFWLRGLRVFLFHRRLG